MNVFSLTHTDHHHHHHRYFTRTHRTHQSSHKSTAVGALPSVSSNGAPSSKRKLATTRYAETPSKVTQHGYQR
eukprot:3207488-Karenia_brevis.AAC.1